MKAEEQRATYTATQATTPTEWPIVPFEQVATPQSDRGKRIKQRDYLPEGRIPVIDQGQSLIGGYTNDGDFAFLGELPVVLFGDHTRAVKLVDHRFAVGADGIKIFRPAEGVRPKYLYYWMKSARIPDRGYGRHYQYLRQLSVPLLPPNKQDEIVAEIEKQFSRLDEAVANLKRVKANLKRYKAAVLKAAVEGRLVETDAELARREGRSYETGAQLLQRILETRRSQWKGKGKYKEPSAPNTTDLPELPKGWVWASLDQLSWDSGYGTSAKCSYENAGPAVLRIPNVSKAAIDLADIKYAPSDFLIGEGEFLSPGDMLVIRTNGSKSLIGRAAIVTTRFQQPTTYASYLIRFRLLDGERRSAWVLAYWQSHSSRLWIESKAATSAGQHNISMSVLATAPVPLPPVAEQHRIVAEIDRHLSIQGGTESQADVNLQRSERLRQAILAKAFSGLLVNQPIPREAIAASVGKR